MKAEKDATSPDRVARTVAYYDRFAQQVAARIERRDMSRAIQAFTAHLAPGATILDIGCGTGDHMRRLAALGFRVVGVEPSAEMRALVSGKGMEVVDGTYETLPDLDLPPIHGVWCAASLLHVPMEHVVVALGNVRQRLPAEGPLFVTVRVGSGGSWDRYDDEDKDEARFIQLFSPDELEAALGSASFTITESWMEDSTWGRPSQWVSIMAVAK